MLDATSYLKEFIERLTRLNQGRAMFTTPETLGDYVLVDFIEQKRAQRGSGGRGARSRVAPGRRRPKVRVVVTGRC